MTQFARPTRAAADYDSTIIGALELSEKNGCSRFNCPESNGIHGMWWKLAATNWSSTLPLVAKFKAQITER